MKTWAAVLLQSQICSFVPSAVPPPGMSRHLPSACRVLPTCTYVHCWAPVPLQPQICTGVPLAVPDERTSRHRPLVLTSAWPPGGGGGGGEPPPEVYAAT